MKEAEENPNGMGYYDMLCDATKCSQLSLGQKRKLVHEIAQWPKDAPKILQSWTCKDLQEIIAAEMGRNKKYTRVTKFKMIELLLNLVSQKFVENDGDDGFLAKAESQVNWEKRKKRNPSNMESNVYQVPLHKVKENVKSILCQNLACRATLSEEEGFCKRCACCICHQYDDNKDPSLWLTCSSESPDEKGSCGLSCHLKCAMNHERAGIMNNRSLAKLDGRFYCVSCGKVNGLMRTWRKQIVIAKDARRVDALCLRLSLSHKLLKGTNQFKELLESVEAAVNKLKNEVGPLDEVSDSTARGIVNRLTCGSEVQKLCSSALVSFDAMYSVTDPHIHCQPSACEIQIEQTSPHSVVILLKYEDHLLKEFLGCRLWHRKSAVKDYPEQPTYIVLKPQKRFELNGLCPSTAYSCKISCFSSLRILGVWETSWVTQMLRKSSVSTWDMNEELAKEETFLKVKAGGNTTRTNYRKINKLTLSNQQTKLCSLDNISTCDNEEMLLMSSVEDVLSADPRSLPPSTPGKSCETRDIVSGPWTGKGLGESEYDYSVRIIKWLEGKGHISEDFRVKFLTWFSLKATTQQRRVVSVFVGALADDPSSLAGQLLDTFTGMICCEKKRGSGKCSTIGCGI